MTMEEKKLFHGNKKIKNTSSFCSKAILPALVRSLRVPFKSIRHENKDQYLGIWKHEPFQLILGNNNLSSHGHNNTDMQNNHLSQNSRTMINNELITTIDKMLNRQNIVIIAETERQSIL